MIKIANAPCSWGILEFGLDGNTNTYEKVLNEMHETGYLGTELGDWGFMPSEPNQLKVELDQRKLNLVGAFVPVNFKNPADHESGLNLALKTARLLKETDPEHARIVLSDDNGKNETRTKLTGRIKPEHSLSPDNWRVFANGVENIAKTVKDETGLNCVFHHHCAGYIETPWEIEKLLDSTSPEYVNLCFDTGHYAFGGGDPVEALTQFRERIGHVHFKDWSRTIFDEVVEDGLDYFEAVGKGIFCELGKGSIDFSAVLDELNKQKYSGWIVVEQDVLPGMGSPKESAKRNRDFLTSIGL
ncbi:MAG: xylose isomerase [Balneolaceae bacterium]|nr:MAG: xylose isomerase [Balneolaceae bacterium]